MAGRPARVIVYAERKWKVVAGLGVPRRLGGYRRTASLKEGNHAVWLGGGHLMAVQGSGPAG